MIAFRGGALKASGFRNGLGSGFRGLIDYLQKGRAPELSEVPEIAGEKVGMATEPSDLPEGGRVAWSSTRNLPTDDIDRAPYWMRAWANQNPRVEKPVYHLGVAVATASSTSTHGGSRDSSTTPKEASAQRSR